MQADDIHSAVKWLQTKGKVVKAILGQSLLLFLCVCAHVSCEDDNMHMLNAMLSQPSTIMSHVHCSI